jgi:hypothetical protein
MGAFSWALVWIWAILGPDERLPYEVRGREKTGEKALKSRMQYPK